MSGLLAHQRLVMHSPSFYVQAYNAFNVVAPSGTSPASARARFNSNGSVGQILHGVYSDLPSPIDVIYAWCPRYGSPRCANYEIKVDDLTADYEASTGEILRASQAGLASTAYGELDTVNSDSTGVWLDLSLGPYEWGLSTDQSIPNSGLNLILRFEIRHKTLLSSVYHHMLCKLNGPTQGGGVGGGGGQTSTNP